VTQPGGDLEPLVNSTLQDILGSLVDVMGMLAVAAGTGWGLWEWIGPFALIPAGLMLIFLSAVAAGLRNRPEPVQEDPRPAVQPLPGPGHPGRVHISGR
jgi:hypothetical protein